VPEADSDFAYTAHVFAYWIARDPQSFNVSPEAAASLEETVNCYRDTLAALGRARIACAQSPQLRMEKDRTRQEAECAVRALANIIRADPMVSDHRKKMLRIKVRAKKLRRQKCPKSPPRLAFLGSGNGVTGDVPEGSGSGVHVLRFADCNESVPVQASSDLGRVRRAKPDGAQRVELFFDMVPVGERVPRGPSERGWPKYLRSFTRSPMEVEFPVPSEPMLFVYWARWADSAGEVSRWSQPCVARVEGWTADARPALPELPESRAAIASRVETKYVYLTSPTVRELPDRLEGDDLLEEIAALAARQRMLEAAHAKRLDPPQRRLLEAS